MTRKNGRGTREANRGDFRFPNCGADQGLRICLRLSSRSPSLPAESIDRSSPYSLSCCADWLAIMICRLAVLVPMLCKLIPSTLSEDLALPLDTRDKAPRILKHLSLASYCFSSDPCVAFRRMSKLMNWADAGKSRRWSCLL